jgi:hypothetical protein
MQRCMLQQGMQDQIHVPIPRKSDTRRIRKETSLAHHRGIPLAWAVTEQRKGFHVAGSFNKGPGTDRHESCLGELDAYSSSTAYAQLEHMSIASGRLQFTMIIYEVGALALLNFLIHGQSSESLTPSGRLATGNRQEAEIAEVLSM